MFGNSSCCFRIFEGFLGLLTLISFLLITGPLLVTVFVVFQSYRLTLVLYVKLFRKDIIGIMGGNNPVVAIDNIHTRPLFTVVCYVAFEGESLENLMHIARNFALDTDPVTHELVYPETHQFYEEWMGFLWWKREQHFLIEDHVKVWQDKGQVSDKEFLEIMNILEAKPFPKGTSPWEVVILPNVLFASVKNPEVPKSVIVFRFHHGLADGMSIIQMCMKCVLKDTMDKVQKPAFKRKSRVEKLSHLWSISQWPYLFLKQMFCAWDRNEWHLPERKLSRNIFKSWSKRIPISLIKEIKNHHEVAFTAVLLSVVAGALRKMMIKHSVKVPKKINAMTLLPWPNHPQKLCNHWSFGFLELPTGEENPERRLDHVHNYIEEMKLSIMPAANYYVINLFNMVPTWILKNLLLSNYLSTVNFSNIPGPPSKSLGPGCKLVDGMFTYGPGRGNMGIQISILSYGDAVRIAVSADSSIFTTQRMTDELIDVVETEFYELRQSISDLP